MSYPEFIKGVARAFELLAVATLVIGTLIAVAKAFRVIRAASQTISVYRVLRDQISRTILLVLEILVAADLLQTVTIEPTLHNVFVLSMIVLVRTFLSFSIETEIQGTLPWRRQDPSAEALPAHNGGLPSHPNHPPA
jgi:uncharacterized membrane protein